MSKLKENFCITENMNNSYDENTGLFNLKKIDYKIDQKFLN
jgi:hypothetical protein